MSRKPPPGFYVIAVIVIFIWFVLATRNHERHLPDLHLQPAWAKTPLEAPHLLPETQHGAVVMAKLGNETIKAELGRAAWKLFHTTFAQFPDKPTADESDALKSYIYLFARLYPCGECAEHFQKIIKKYPPQTSSRSTAAAWGCFVHNEVNTSKDKPLFDCANIGDFYDCGCAKDEADTKGKDASITKKHSEDSVEIDREGPTQGG